jgi:hypothetical protein
LKGIEAVEKREQTHSFLIAILDLDGIDDGVGSGC